MTFTSINIPKGATSIVVDPELNMIYLKYPESILCIDGYTNALDSTNKVSDLPINPTIHRLFTDLMKSKGSYIFHNHEMNLKYVINSESLGVEGATVTRVWLEIIDSKNYEVINTKNLSETDEVVINPNMNRVYINKMGKGHLIKLDAFAKKTLETIKFPGSNSLWRRFRASLPNSMTLNPVTNKLYLKDDKLGILHIVDG